MPHFTHRTPCDRVIRPTPRRVLSPRIGWVDLEFHATPRSNGRLRRDSFLVEDRRDGDDYCRASRRICALIVFCEFSVARIECMARLIIHRSKRI